MPSVLQKPTAPQTAAKPKQQGWPSWQWSFVGLAVASIVGIDFAARAFYHPDRFSSPNRSWAWWATTAYNQQPKPDVAVFGSSLMLAALNDGDATYINQHFDAVQHHRAVYLESLLAQKLNRPLTCSSLAIGGQMASDVYVFGRNLFTSQKSPQLVIWGIAPRDFVDSSFTDPDNSETVRYFKKVTGSTNVLGRHRHLIWNDIQSNLEKAFYLYGKRQDLTASAIEIAKCVLCTISGAKTLDTVQLPRPLLRYAILNLPEDNGLLQWQVTPYSPKKHFEDNTAEYRQRYTPFRPRVLATQLNYLQRFLALTRDSGIKVLLVNMPITEANLKLLPPGVYDNYLDQVKHAATTGSATLLDLNKPGVFQSSEFADTVHLNGLGGMHFFKLVSEHVPAADLGK